MFSLLSFKALSLNGFPFYVIFLDLLLSNSSLLLSASSATTIPPATSGKQAAPLISTDARSNDWLIIIDHYLGFLEFMFGWSWSFSFISAWTEWQYALSDIRSSRSKVFLGKSVLKICSKLTGEHPCRSAIPIKLQLYWNRTLAYVFSCKLAAYFQNTFS